ncbi:MAG: hypothetical protein LBQ61_07305, partial [Spirochaetales bacterium]|nr:hypothetical protein [Spirochaetales bacterium]
MKTKSPLMTFIQMLALIALMAASCDFSPLDRLPKEASEYVVEIGKGTPYYLYLDDNYEPVTTPLGETDPGKTVLVVEDNPGAAGVMVLAETSPEEEDDVVRIINRNNGGVISLFFHKGRDFPWFMDLRGGETAATARIYQYDWARQEYSAVFTQNGEERSFDNLILNKSILRAYADDPAIREDQNDRLRRIITSLGIFLSLRQAMGGGAVTVLSAQPAAVEDFWTALPAVSFA